MRPPPTTQSYSLSLHDALPICSSVVTVSDPGSGSARIRAAGGHTVAAVASIVRTAWREPGPKWWSSRAQRSAASAAPRSEEHTSELQSPCNLVCRLLLEKKKKQ